MVKVVINVVITFSISEKTGIFRVYGRLRGGRAMSKIYFTILGYLLWLMGRNKESNKIRKVIYDNLLHVRYNNEQEV